MSAPIIILTPPRTGRTAAIAGSHPLEAHGFDSVPLAVSYLQDPARPDSEVALIVEGAVANFENLGDAIAFLESIGE